MNDQYRNLVQMLQGGAKLAPDLTGSILASCGKTHADLTRDIFGGSDEPAVMPGDQCDCGGSIFVYSSRKKGIDRHQYLKCDRCQNTHGKRIIPESQIRKRKKRSCLT
ncbi:hypothetical protein [Gimesia sp.]|uniref:hypothetical protein n=1 Tax=Gimesia sp. TaxID=2024833 RepID=UPI003A8EFE0C